MNPLEVMCIAHTRDNTANRHTAFALLSADAIREDDKLYRMVVDYMDEKAGKIRSIKDIRDRLAQDIMTKKPYEKASKEANNG